MKKIKIEIKKREAEAIGMARSYFSGMVFETSAYKEDYKALIRIVSKIEKAIEKEKE
jgi:hypothetical protein